MQQLAVLCIMLVGLAVMLQAIRLRTAFWLIIGAALLPVLAPVLVAMGWQLVHELPLLMRLFIMALLGIAALRLCLRLLLGRRASDEVAADLTTDLIRWAERAVLFPVRLGGRLFRLLFGR